MTTVNDVDLMLGLCRITGQRMFRRECQKCYETRGKHIKTAGVQTRAACVHENIKEREGK